MTGLNGATVPVFAEICSTKTTVLVGCLNALKPPTSMFVLSSNAESCRIFFYSAATSSVSHL